MDRKYRKWGSKYRNRLGDNATNTGFCPPLPPFFAANPPKSAISEHQTRSADRVASLLRTGLSECEAVFRLAQRLTRGDLAEHFLETRPALG